MASMDGIDCSLKVLQQFKNLSVTVFGKPSSWTEALVVDLGNIVGKSITPYRNISYSSLGQKLTFPSGNILICVPKLGWMHLSWLLWTHLSLHLSARPVFHSSRQIFLL